MFSSNFQGVQENCDQNVWFENKQDSEERDSKDRRKFCQSYVSFVLYNRSVTFDLCKIRMCGCRENGNNSNILLHDTFEVVREEI